MASDHVFNSAIDSLVATDRSLAWVVAEHGRPGRFLRPPTFQTLVLLILEQQVSLDSARAAYDRLELAVPDVDPVGVLELSDDEMHAIGFSRQKSRYARELASRVIDGRLSPERLGELDDGAARERLMAVPGIGPWTADVFLMSSLGRPDIWPVADRALQVAVGEALDLEAIPGPAELVEIGARWRPHRTAAAQILWHGYLSRRNRTIPMGAP